MRERVASSVPVVHLWHIQTAIDGPCCLDGSSNSISSILSTNSNTSKASPLFGNGIVLPGIHRSQHTSLDDDYRPFTLLIASRTPPLHEHGHNVKAEPHDEAGASKGELGSDCSTNTITLATAATATEMATATVTTMTRIRLASSPLRPSLSLCGGWKRRCENGNRLPLMQHSSSSSSSPRAANGAAFSSPSMATLIPAALQLPPPHQPNRRRRASRIRVHAQLVLDRTV